MDDYLEFAQTNNFYHKGTILNEEDSGFKAWQADSALIENNTNLLRNFKSQLVNYQRKFQKQNMRTIPIKLPSLQKFNKKHSKKPHSAIHDNSDGRPLTQRKHKNKQKQVLIQHRSIQLNRNPLQHIKPSSEYTKQKSTINYNRQQPIQIAKIHQMKFDQNKLKRLRKRDIYISIFGQKGKSKVQKLAFDDENQPHQTQIQRKNTQLKKKQDENPRYKLKTTNNHQRVSSIAMRF